MKIIVVISAIILIGASAVTGAITSASLGWTFKSADESPTVSITEEEINQKWNISLEQSDEPFVWVEPNEVETTFWNISFQLPMPLTNSIELTVDKAVYKLGENVNIKLENNGIQTAYFIGSDTIWSIEEYKDNKWEVIYPDILLTMFVETQIQPGETKEYIWDQTTMMNGQVETGEYRVSINYYIDENKYEFIEYVYFSISNTIGIFQGFSPDENYKILNNTIFWNENQKITVTLPPTQTTPYEEPHTIPYQDLFPPPIPIEEVSVGKYINATDSITIYDITDSIKIYDPNGGYWWFPIYPYQID